MDIASLILALMLSSFIGYRTGLQARWSNWHGPVAGLIVMPLAYVIGFDAMLSIVAPIGLMSGFLWAHWK